MVQVNDMFRIYNEARRYRDDPNLDHREYLASKNLSEQDFELLIAQLEPIQGEEYICTTLSQIAEVFIPIIYLI